MPGAGEVIVGVCVRDYTRVGKPDIDGTDGRRRIARRVAADRVISTVGLKARHTRKSKSVRRDGYRAHLACEPETGLITDAQLTMATGTDNTDAAMGGAIKEPLDAYRDRPQCRIPARRASSLSTRKG